MNAKEADILRKHLLAEMPFEDRALVKMVEAIRPGKLNWKPTPEKSKSAADLAWHCAAPALFFLSCVEGTPTPSPKRSAKSKAKLIDAIERVQTEFAKRVAAMTPAALAKDAAFFDETFPAITLLSWHKAHLIHHRGQLSLYLRIMGAKVPGVYGPSGDDEQPKA